MRILDLYIKTSDFIIQVSSMNSINKGTQANSIFFVDDSDGDLSITFASAELRDFIFERIGEFIRRRKHFIDLEEEVKRYKK